MNSDKNKIAVEIFDKLADVYQNKFMNVSTYAKTLDLFCDGVRQGNAEILQTTSQNVMNLKNSPLIGQKTMWEKEKLLVKSNFAFSHNDF